MKDLTIYNVYVEMESQEQCDRMQKLCIDNDLCIWYNPIAFDFIKEASFVFNYFEYEFYVDSFKPIAMKNKTKVTEGQFINLLKKHKHD